MQPRTHPPWHRTVKRRHDHFYQLIYICERIALIDPTSACRFSSVLDAMIGVILFFLQKMISAVNKEVVAKL